jgi:hypothetical protein
LYSLKEAAHLEDLGMEGGMLLKYFLNKYVIRVWAGFEWDRTYPKGELL